MTVRVLALMLLALGGELSAQSSLPLATPPPLTPPAPTTGALDQEPPEPRPPAPPPALFAGGVGGSVLGGLGGGFALYYLTRGGDSSEDPGLAGALAGVFMGTLMGSAIGVTIADGRSVSAGPAAIGAFVGTAAAFLVASAARDEALVIPLLPFGQATFGTLFVTLAGSR
jgi:hypothetical protein